MTKRLQIGVVSHISVNDRRGTSGTVYRIAKALEKHCGDIVEIGPIKVPAEPLALKAMWKLEALLTGKQYRWKRSRRCARVMAADVEQRLKERPCDILFSDFASWAIALVKTDLPLFDCGDSTTFVRFNMDPRIGMMTRRSFREGNDIQRHLAQREAGAILCSKWAADSVIQDYGAPQDRVWVVPFGANLDSEDVPSRQVVLSRRRSASCRLLFLAARWELKGGPIAFQTLLELEKLGLKAELTVCGCVPSPDITHERLRVIPFLDKNNPAQRRELSQLLASHDLLFVPTRSDTYGIVWCEANAFGLPAIATSVGAVGEVIRDGENGYTLPYEATAAQYARLIYDLYTDEERYVAMVRTSREAYETRLNWDAWGQSVQRILRQALPPQLAGKVGPT